ncbi:MAG: D-glycerate dehydrogenase [Saprospiraceae bacterium]|nr:D-glycerate dehydrogenase [Saprospiraceae bacterium]
MEKIKVFISRQLPITAEDLLSQADFEVVVWQEEYPMPKSTLIEQCQSASALLCTGIDEIDAGFLEACPHLEIISTFAVGFDNIDINAATKIGISVGHTPGVLTEATAEIAFGLMLSVARHFLDTNRQIGKGEWKYFIPTKNLGIDLKGKTLGIFGLGAIGFEMARRSKAVYDMNIIYCNRNINHDAEKQLGAKRVSMDELLSQSDVLSVHASLNADTKGIFNKGAFSKMKKTAIFINTARGGLHVEEDLIGALESNEIWGAGLDVTNPEPMHPDNKLLSMPRVLVLPHIGSSTYFTRSEMARLAAENIIHFFRNGKP